MQCATGGAVWVSHLRCKGAGTFKLPAVTALGPAALADVPVVADPPLFLRHGTAPATFQEVWVTVDGGVAYVHSDFYNGAASTEQCQQLTAALQQVRTRADVKVVVLMGGDAFFSNGIHLNTIQAAADPAAESWKNINAINDVVQAVFRCGPRRVRGRTASVCVLAHGCTCVCACMRVCMRAA